MPRKPRLKLPPLNLGSEKLGQRIARLRKKQGLTQTELARKIGIIQALVSDYERNNLRLSAEMAVRFAVALQVSVDELLGLKMSMKKGNGEVSLKLIRRMKKIESLPPAQQKTLLRRIDTFIAEVRKR